MILHSKMGPIELSADTIAALQTRYPTKDVARELQLAHLWLLEHERRRPKRIYAFLRNWLARSPDVRRPAPINSAWWTTPEATMRQGEAMGVAPVPSLFMVNSSFRVA